MIKRKLKPKYKRIVILLLYTLCIIGIIYSLYNIINWTKDNDDNKNLKEKIDEGITIIKDDSYKIDFKKLKEQNSDAIAYLKVKGTDIDYVVVKSTNNSYYLNHNFNRKYNTAGWIFADYRNKYDGNDKNLIIYGHNRKDGSMFGTLKNVLDSNWQENKDNLEITLITELGEYKYQVFSTYSIIPEDYYITTGFKSDDEYLKFLNNIKSRSNHDYNVEVSENDTILTLSSCNKDGSKRVVLHAKQIESEDN